MKKNEIVFKQIEQVDSISKVIQEVFGVKLDIEGGWGYDNKNPVIIKTLDIPIDQFLHMFATIRSNIEMNLTLQDDERYGGIKVNFVNGQQLTIENKTYDMITFEITAMKEKIYAEFIQEYKDNYGKNSDFDMDEHFKKRQQNTISVMADFWFIGLEDYYYVEKATSDMDEIDG